MPHNAKSLVFCRDPHLVRGLKGETVTSVACGAYCTAVISNKRNAKSTARQLAAHESAGGRSSSCSSADGINSASEFTATGRLWVWGQHQVRGRESREDGIVEKVNLFCPRSTDTMHWAPAGGYVKEE